MPTRFTDFVIQPLVTMVVKILSLNLRGPLLNPLARGVEKELSQPYQEIIPPLSFDELHPHLYWEQILREREASGNPILPVNHRKPVPQQTSCPDCGAPHEYIYNYAEVSVASGEKEQKHRCKVCGRQWIPAHARNKHTTLYCPHCRSPLVQDKKRPDFTIHKCRNDSCPHWLKHKKRYRYRLYDVSLEKLTFASPARPKVQLNRSHFSYVTIAMVLTLYTGFCLSSREVVQLMNGFFSLSLSHQTILNWAASAAYLLYPLLNNLPVVAGAIWVVDETYLRYKGQWGYLFTVLDGEHGSIIAQIFSPTRSTAAGYAVLRAALQRVGEDLPEMLTIVSDGLASYALAMPLIRRHFGLSAEALKHIIVLGLSDPSGTVKNEYRRYKNLIENYYSVLKPYYSRTKGFGSFAGGVVFSILFHIYFNYLHPSSRHQGKPAIEVEGLDHLDPLQAWQKLVEMATEGA